MEYVDFSALIQLGVVFNFAFIFEHLEPVKLFRKIFSNLNDDFKNSDQKIDDIKKDWLLKASLFYCSFSPSNKSTFSSFLLL